MRALETKNLYGFVFCSLENKHEFMRLERKLDDANMILDDVPPSDYTRLNLQTYKRDKILYDLFEMVFKDSGHNISYRNYLVKSMREHLEMLCVQSNREYSEYARKFMDEVEVDEYEGI